MLNQPCGMGQHFLPKYWLYLQPARLVIGRTIDEMTVDNSIEDWTHSYTNYRRMIAK